MLNFNLMLLGRAIYGAGSETLYCCQMVIVTRWFYDKELSFALGVSIGLPNVIAFAGGFYNYRAYKLYGMGNAFMIDAFACALSLAAGVMLIKLDQKVFDQKLDKQKQNTVSMPKCSDLKSLSNGFWLNVLDAGITSGIFNSSIAIGTEELMVRFDYDE